MKLEEAIEKVGDKWQTGGYFTADEICDLNDMLLELQELRKRDAERANGREEFMTVVYDELSDDSDNCRANRIIDAADEYVEEAMRLEQDND